MLVCPLTRFFVPGTWKHLLKISGGGSASRSRQTSIRSLKNLAKPEQRLKPNKLASTDVNDIIVKIAEGRVFASTDEDEINAKIAEGRVFASTDVDDMIVKIAEKQKQEWIRIMISLSLLPRAARNVRNARMILHLHFMLCFPYAKK